MKRKKRKNKVIKPGDVTITFCADAQKVAAQYTPPSETIRTFVERNRREMRIESVVAQVMFHFYLPELKLTFPLRSEELISVAEKESARLEAEEQRSGRAYALPG